MEIGISLHALTQPNDDRRPLAAALRYIRAAGADHIMLLSRPGGPTVEPGKPCPATLVDLPQSDPEELLWRVARAGLYLSMIYVGAVDVSTPAALEQTRRTLRTHAALAMRLGVGVLVHNVGRAASVGQPTADKATEIEHLAGLMEEIVGEYGIRTAGDMHVHGLIETPNDARYYQAITRDERVGLLLNIGHMTTLGLPGEELLGDRTVRIPVIAWKDHLKPVADSHEVRSVELGQGHSPFDRYVAALKGRAKMPLSLISWEHVPYEHEPQAAAQSVAYLREVWRRGRLLQPSP